MYLLRVDIPSCAGTYCFSRRAGVVGVCVCYGAVEDEVCGFAAVFMGGVVRVAGIALVVVATIYSGD
jgi:hypothetical protein